MKPGETVNNPLHDGRQSERARDIARGATRLLARQGYRSIPELTLVSGRRADLVCVGEKGEIWIVEIKSSLEDFRADNKWPDYLEWCDRFFFAVAADFPAHLIPDETGLILADRYDGELVQMPAEDRLPAARRRSLLLRFARLAAGRLMTVADPEAAYEPLHWS
ncbi:MAG: MmcB family DNA repair protein [Hyphomicrobiaceae bacterium]